MKKIITGACFIAILLSGCARDLTSGNYDAFSVGQSEKTYEGVIQSMRGVKVKNPGGTGTLAGGGLGALGGSELGKGKGSIAGAIGGAVVGAVAGNMTEQEITKQEAYEYVVKLSDGSLRSVVQSDNELFSVGQKVYLMEPSDKKAGHARLVAR